jgi:hypothetical protein
MLTRMMRAETAGRSHPVLEDYADRVLAFVDEQPGRTLDKFLAAARHKRPIPGCGSALWRFLDHHEITFKKGLRFYKLGGAADFKKPALVTSE